MSAAPLSRVWFRAGLAATPALAILVFSTDHFTTFSVPKQVVAWLGVLFCVVCWRLGWGEGPAVVFVRQKERWWGWLVFLFLLWSGCSLWWTSAFSRGEGRLLLWLLGGLWSLLWWIGLCVLEGGERRATVELQSVWVWVLLAGTCSALLGIFQRFVGGRVGWHHVTGTIGNPNRLAGVLLLMLPIAWWCVVAPGRKCFRWLGVVGGVICLVGIGSTRCQSAVLASLLMCMLWIWKMPGGLGERVGGFRRWVGVAFVGCGAVGVWWLWPYVLKGVGARVWLGRLSLLVWWEKPLCGVGLGGYPGSVAWVQARELLGSGRGWTLLLDPHNQLLEIGVSLGVVGLLLWLLVCGGLLWRCVGLRREVHALAALGAWLGGGIYSMSETSSLSVSFVLVGVSWGMLGAFSLRCGRVGAGGGWSGRGVVWWVLLSCVVWGVLQSGGRVYGDWQMGRGMKSASLGDREGMKRAVEFYSAGLGFVGEPSQVLFSRGLAFRELGAREDALRDLRASFVLLPSPETALAISACMFEGGASEEAIHWAKVSIRLHPRYARGYHNLGVMYLSRDEKKKAWRYLRRARSLRPGDRRFLKAWRRLPRRLRRLKPLRLR